MLAYHMHFQPSELDVMEDDDVEFWFEQLHIEFENQKTAINSVK